MNNRQSSSSRLSQNARQSDEDQSKAAMHLKEILLVNSNNKHSNQSSLVMHGGLTSSTNSKVNTRTASKAG